jgi:hypothetical protein
LMVIATLVGFTRNRICWGIYLYDHLRNEAGMRQYQAR